MQTNRLKNRLSAKGMAKKRKKQRFLGFFAMSQLIHSQRAYIKQSIICFQNKRLSAIILNI